MKDDGFDSWMRAEGFVTPANDFGDRAFCYPENAFGNNETIEPETKKRNQLLTFLKELRARLVAMQKDSTRAYQVSANDAAFNYYKHEFNDCTPYNNGIIVPDHDDIHRSR